MNAELISCTRPQDMTGQRNDTQLSNVEFTLRDHGRGSASTGTGRLTKNAWGGLEYSHNSSQVNRAWTMPDPIPQLAVDTGNSASQLSVGASNVDAMADSTEDAAQDGSYGTLMLSEGGRSKYLGPTAGSEWLRDVCQLTIDMMRKLSYNSPKLKMHQVHRLQLRLVHQVQRFRMSPCQSSDIAVLLED